MSFISRLEVTFNGSLTVFFEHCNRARVRILDAVWSEISCGRHSA